MSYSFTVQAPSKEEVELKVRDKLMEVSTMHPVHVIDYDAAFKAAQSFIALLAEPPAGQSISVAVNGSIWKTDAGVQQVSVTVSAQVYNNVT